MQEEGRDGECEGREGKCEGREMQGEGRDGECEGTGMYTCKFTRPPGWVPKVFDCDGRDIASRLRQYKVLIVKGFCAQANCVEQISAVSA